MWKSSSRRKGSEKWIYLLSTAKTNENITKLPKNLIYQKLQFDSPCWIPFYKKLTPHNKSYHQKNWTKIQWNDHNGFRMATEWLFGFLLDNIDIYTLTKVFRSILLKIVMDVRWTQDVVCISIRLITSMTRSQTQCKEVEMRPLWMSC